MGQNMATPKKLKYNFVLLGKTGSGKSSTGNTLLDLNIFKSVNSLFSCTENSILQSNTIDEIIFTVVDTPGVYDTNKSMAQTLALIHEGIGLIPDGFNALLLVIKLTEKVTQEFNETVKALKASFGDSTFMRYCVIIFTHGDAMPELKNETIEDWCRSKDNIKEGSFLSTLLSQCQYRVVLFYNNDYDKRLESVSKLLSYLDPQAPRYTHKLFAKCAKERDAYFISLGFPEQTARIQESIANVQAAFKKVLATNDGRQIQIQGILSTLNELEKTIEQESKGTDQMDALKYKVNELKKHALGLLKLGEKEKIEEIKKLDKDIDSMKFTGIASCVGAFISGGALTVDGAFLGLGAMTLAPGIAICACLGVVTIGLAVYTVYSFKKAYDAKKKK